MLIYPKWSNFDKEKQFNLGDDLNLYVFPFDLTDPIISANKLLKDLNQV
jgi:hypothetical protein